MPDINDLLNDPEFAKLSLKDQHELQLRFLEKYPKPGPASAPQAPIESITMGDRAADSFEKLPPWMQQVAKRGTAAGVGYLTGGPLNAAIMGALPPETPGQWGASMLAGPAGKLAGKAVSAVSNPAIKSLMSGLGGLGSYLGLGAATEGIDRTLTAAGAQNIPQRNVIPQSTEEAINQAPGMLLSSLAPMMGQVLTGNLVKSRPGTVSAQAVKDIAGGAGEIDIPGLEKFRTLQQNAPELLDVLSAGKRPTPEQLANITAQQKVQTKLDKMGRIKAGLKEKKAELDVDKASIDREIAKKVEAIRQKEVNKTYGRASEEDIGALKIEQEGLKVANKNINLEKKGNVEWRKAKIENIEEGLQKQLDELKLKANDPAMALHPEIGKITTASTPRELMQNLSNASPEGIGAYRKQIERELGPSGVRNMQDGLINQFFKEAYNPGTKVLSNAAKLFNGSQGTPGKFSDDKIRAIFGNGPEAEQKVQLFKEAVDDISQVDTSQWRNALTSTARSFGKHMGWILPNMLVFHADQVMGGGVAAAGAIGTAGMLAVTYPKLIDAILRNPKLGQSFHKWATGTTRIERSLSSWPRLAAWVKANAEPVEEPTEKELLTWKWGSPE